jgi:hypothetical protein
VTDARRQIACIFGCGTPVPAELETERLCVLHFILSVDYAYSEIRREAALDRASTARRSEMADYIKATAMKLIQIATGSARLTDDMKKRFLTTFLTLMNLQEDIDRSTSRFAQLRSLQPMEAPDPAPSAVAS